MSGRQAGRRLAMDVRTDVFGDRLHPDFCFHCSLVELSDGFHGRPTSCRSATISIQPSHEETGWKCSKSPAGCFTAPPLAGSLIMAMAATCFRFRKRFLLQALSATLWISLATQQRHQVLPPRMQQNTEAISCLKTYRNSDFNF